MNNLLNLFADWKILIMNKVELLLHMELEQ